MHVKTTPISGIIPHFVSSNSFLFLPSNQILTEEIDLPVGFEEMVSPENANWISDLIDTDYGSFTIQGPGFSWPVHQPLGVSSNSRTACVCTPENHREGCLRFLSRRFWQSITARRKDDRKRREKERTQTKCSVLEEGQVSRCQASN
ncbi:hypothetical protein HID58_069378 [Brassica napus]|uniref:Uncharacterized protein n=1 Tax=Brassica napus TaxID=3708 RepID=A0ABQ7YVV9_BRANA|nr:hypothetical protein HID58_069378 [Brassica napus]